MVKRAVNIKVSYTTEDAHMLSKDIKEERRRVLEYIKELIESDFHKRFNLKIKELKDDTSGI